MSNCTRLLFSIDVEGQMACGKRLFLNATIILCYVLFKETFKHYFKSPSYLPVLLGAKRPEFGGGISVCKLSLVK